MANVRHLETGTGVSVRDNGKGFGSRSRLRGVMQLPSASSLLLGHALHEIMHLWMDDIVVVPTTHRGHWGFSSVHGVLGGFNKELLVPLGHGKYSAGEFGLKQTSVSRDRSVS